MHFLIRLFQLKFDLPWCVKYAADVTVFFLIDLLYRDKFSCGLPRGLTSISSKIAPIEYQVLIISQIKVMQAVTFEQNWPYG